MLNKLSTKRWLALLIGVLGLITVYVFQRQFFYDPIQEALIAYGKRPDDFNRTKFALSKILRYILNDGFSILIIYALFEAKKYMRFAVAVFLFGFVILLPIYLVLTLYFSEEAYSFLNHLHRLVLNPLLMILLIPAFYYQRQLSETKSS